MCRRVTTCVTMTTNLESERAANILRNQTMLQDIFHGGQLTPVPLLPISSSTPVSKPTKHSRKSVAPVLPPRTHSRKGSWKCVSGCDTLSADVPAFVKHLKTVHNLFFDVEHLAPLGLAQCAFATLYSRLSAGCRCTRILARTHVDC